MAAYVRKKDGELVMNSHGLLAAYRLGCSQLKAWHNSRAKRERNRKQQEHDDVLLWAYNRADKNRREILEWAKRTAPQRLAAIESEVVK